MKDAIVRSTNIVDIMYQIVFFAQRLNIIDINGYGIRPIVK